MAVAVVPEARTLQVRQGLCASPRVRGLEGRGAVEVDGASVRAQVGAAPAPSWFTASPRSAGSLQCWPVRNVDHRGQERPLAPGRANPIDAPEMAAVSGMFEASGIALKDQVTRLVELALARA